MCPVLWRHQESREAGGQRPLHEGKQVMSSLLLLGMSLKHVHLCSLVCFRREKENSVVSEGKMLEILAQVGAAGSGDSRGRAHSGELRCKRRPGAVRFVLQVVGENGGSREERG